MSSVTTGDWRDRWEERDRHGNQVVYVNVRKDGGYEYAYIRPSDQQMFVSVNLSYLIPKPQPPRPKKYRPYTEAELWDLIQQHKGVLWVKEKDKKRWISVDRTENAGFLFKHYTHLDGSPFGMEVSDD